MNLGNNLKKIREQKKLSQMELSKLSNVPQTTISNIERNIANPTVNTLIAITKSLKIDVNELLK